MTMDDIDKYLCPALHNVYGVATVGTANAFYRFIGSDEYDRYGMRDYTPMSEDHRNLLRQLSGPHWQTVLKAYKVKYGIKRDHTEGCNDRV